MLPLLKQKSMSPFSTTRNQIKHVNSIIQKINKYQQKNQPLKAIPYIDKLAAYIQQLDSEEKIKQPIKEWAEQNSLDEFKKSIISENKQRELQKTVKHLTKKAKLSSIYRLENSPSTYPNLIGDKLKTIDENLEFESLNAENNPAVVVTSPDKNMRFIVRFFRMQNAGDGKHLSPKEIREQCSKDMPQVPAPLAMEPITKEGNDELYFEYSQFYPEGNLKNYFENLREQKEEGNINEPAFDKALLDCSKQLMEFLVSLNERKIWYTDMKPSNILLNEGKIILSDVKGLLASQSYKIPSNMINATKGYYSSNVFFNDNSVNLELLQCQTIAATIYQLACGELPEANGSINSWENIYDFSHPVFQSEQGQFIKSIIELFSANIPITMEKALARVKEQLEQMENHPPQSVSNEDDEMYVEHKLHEKHGQRYMKL
ncbi:hypothetical protein [Legionella rowbothamii]|uniref:hypothetical protein n=1 Tax=Legionella rowbothamii TaxID=96229 RepID=UPI001056430B|nr:hypothetical protein [Legionella rowbothamii]